jgi:hypothetical protein
VADFTAEYAAKLRGRLSAAIAAAERDGAPADIVARLQEALQTLDMTPARLARAWSALDACRAWRMDPSGSSTPPTGSSP